MTFYVDGGLGNDLNNGAQSTPFKTIQKAINSAKAGDTIEVVKGNYPERPKTFVSGTETDRITINGNQSTIQGLVFQHSFITLKNFNITNTRTDLSWTGAIQIEKPVVGAWVIGNTVYDLPLKQYPINFAWARGYEGAQDCVISENTIRNTLANMLTVFGKNHIIKNNLFKASNGADAIRCFGFGHIIEWNEFYLIGNNNVTQNHPDILQSFATPDGEAFRNITFRNNWCHDSETQLFQLEEKNGNLGEMFVYNNLFSNISMSANIDIPGFEAFNNTFRNCTRNTGGVLGWFYSVKGNPINGKCYSNIFESNGSDDGKNKQFGWYVVSPEVVSTFYGDYNFVVGAEGSPIKQTAPPNDFYHFNEVHGINNGTRPDFSTDLPVGCKLKEDSVLRGKGIKIHPDSSVDLGCNLDISKVGPGAVISPPLLKPPVVTFSVTTISLVEPANIQLNAVVVPNGHVFKSIEFFINNVSLGVDIDSPYSLNWQNIGQGSYELKARLNYDDSKFLDSPTVSVTISPAPVLDPTISITYPQPTLTLEGPQTIRCQVSVKPNTHTINQVDYWANDKYLGSSACAEFDFLWNNAGVGTYNLVAKLQYDINKSINSSPVILRVLDK